MDLRAALLAGASVLGVAALGVSAHALPVAFGFSFGEVGTTVTPAANANAVRGAGTGGVPGSQVSGGIPAMAAIFSSLAPGIAGGIAGNVVRTIAVGNSLTGLVGRWCSAAIPQHWHRARRGPGRSVRIRRRGGGPSGKETQCPHQRPAHGPASGL